jgi:hypothetical protein
MSQAQLIRQWSDDVVFFLTGSTWRPTSEKRLVARGVRIVDGEVT